MSQLQAQGSSSVMGYVEERAGWGSQRGPGGAWRTLRFTSEDLGSDINEFQSQELRGDRMTPAVTQGNRRADGGVNFEFGPNSHNLLLRHAIAGFWDTSDSTDPFDYVITGSSIDPSDDTVALAGSGALPVGGLTVVKGYTDLATPQYQIFTGARVDQFTLDFPQEGIVTGSASFLTKAETIATSAPWSSLTAPALDPYDSVDTEIYIAAYDSSGIPSWGTKIGIITGGRMSISNNLDGNSYVLGSTARYEIPAGRRIIEGSLSMVFADMTYYQAYLDGDPVAVRIRFRQGTYEHDIRLPNVRYSGTKPSPTIPGEQGITFDLPFKALRHATLQTDISCAVRCSELIATT